MRADNTTTSEVFILVLVEVPIGEPIDMSKAEVITVLILVLVEVPIGALAVYPQPKDNLGLNPCFSGSSYRRVWPLSLVQMICRSLNPCFSGSSYRRNSTISSEFSKKKS